MNSILVDVIKETLEITFFILIMMAAVDIINVWTRGKISLLLKGKSKFRQYTVA